MIKNIFWIILLLISLKIGYDLRLIGYNLIPEPYIILDEHTNIWHGVSLRKTGIPTAWSILPFYIDESRTIGAGGPLDSFNLSVDEKKPTLRNYFKFPKPVVGLAEFDFGRGINNTPLVQPYLDHPPLGAFLLGLFVSKDVTTLSEVNNFDLRQGSLYFAVFTQFLIFVLALLITKKPLIGIMASTINGTVPSYLLLSRYALLENVLTPLILFGLILLILAKDKLEINKNNKYINLILVTAGIIGGLGALTKLVGWVFVLACVGLLYFWKFNWRQILKYLLPAIVVGSLYFVWGLWLSPKLFIDLFLTQGSRDFIGSINLLVTFFRVSIYRFPLDGWWIGGFISLLFIPNIKKYLPIIIMTIATLFSALCLVGANYPWYFIPLIPFMSVSIALILYKFASKPTVTSAMLIFLTFVSSSFYWGYGVYQKIQPFNLYRFIVILFIIICLSINFLKDNVKFRKIWYIGVMVLFIILILLNRQSMFYILGNWGKLPLIYTPGTF